jgi:hypothetical protein
VPRADNCRTYSKEKEPIVNQIKIPAAFDVRAGKIIVLSLALFFAKPLSINCA